MGLDREGAGWGFAGAVKGQRRRDGDCASWYAAQSVPQHPHHQLPEIAPFVARDEAADRHARADVQAEQHGIEDRTAHVLEVHVDALRDKQRVA